jgi:hypothetical protein
MGHTRLGHALQVRAYSVPVTQQLANLSGHTCRNHGMGLLARGSARCTGQVMQMLEPPVVLFRPYVMFRLLGPSARAAAISAARQE